MGTPSGIKNPFVSITNDFRIESCNEIVKVLYSELEIFIESTDSSYLQIGLVAIKSKNISFDSIFQAHVTVLNKAKVS